MKKKHGKKHSKTKKGMQYVCSECGAVVSVVAPCGCTDVCDLYCCGMPMKVKKTKKTKRRM